MTRIDNKIVQNKAQYNLDIQTNKIATLSSRSVGIYKLLTGEDILPKKRLLQKAATIKKLEYSPLSSDFKKHIDIAKDLYQRLEMVYEFDKKEEDEKQIKNNN